MLPFCHSLLCFLFTPGKGSGLSAAQCSGPSAAGGYGVLPWELWGRANFWDIPWRVWHTWGHLEQWNEVDKVQNQGGKKVKLYWWLSLVFQADDDWKDCSARCWLQPQAAKQHQGSLPVLPHPCDQLPSAGQWALLQHLLPQTPMWHHALPQLAHQRSSGSLFFPFPFFSIKDCVPFDDILLFRLISPLLSIELILAGEAAQGHSWSMEEGGGKEASLYVCRRCLWSPEPS